MGNCPVMGWPDMDNGSGRGSRSSSDGKEWLWGFS